MVPASTLPVAIERNTELSFKKHRPTRCKRADIITCTCAVAPTVDVQPAGGRGADADGVDANRAGGPSRACLGADVPAGEADVAVGVLTVPAADSAAGALAAIAVHTVGAGTAVLARA